MNPRSALALFRAAYSAWSQDRASRLAAALAYFALFAIAPLLVLLITIVGLVLGPEAAQGRLVAQIAGIVGPESARLVETMIANAALRGAEGVLATAIGVGVLIFGATGLFTAVREALNTIWEVEQTAAGIVGSLKAQIITRLWGFLLVVLFSLLLIAAVITTTLLVAITGPLAAVLPGFSSLWFLLNILISFAVITSIFAITYKVLPAVDTAWGHVWTGAAVTAFLFVVGKELIGLYLGRVSVGSVYGAAGSLAVLLVWIYYSANIFLFGAEFTKVLARRAATPRHAPPGGAPIGRLAHSERATRAESGEQARWQAQPPATARAALRDGRLPPPQAAEGRPAGRRRPGRSAALWSSLVAAVLVSLLLGALRRQRRKR